MIEVIDIGHFVNNESSVDPKKLNLILNQFDKTFRTIGCCHIVGHGIAEEVISQAFSVSSSFFHDTPLSEKMKYVKKLDVIGRGYSAIKTENVASFMGRKDEPNDSVEKFSIGPVKPFPTGADGAVNPGYWSPNVWPENNQQFQSAITTYFTYLDSFYEKLLSLVSLSLGLPQETMYEMCKYGGHSLKINFYPQTPNDDQILLAAHKDATPITILAMDNTKEALSVCTPDGSSWIFVDPVPGALFINLGDIMHRWSNERYPSALHRVNWTPNERMSLVFFILTNANSFVGSLLPNEVAKVTPISYTEWLKEKMENMYHQHNSVLET